MSPELNPPRGTHDILPGAQGGRPSSESWQAAEAAFRSTAQTFGYGEIRTPLFESLDVFTRAIGEVTDIVKKEMYFFQDRKGRDLALRPEGTAGVVRACLTAGAFGQGRPTRLFYIGPMFRYERPQAGRYRQHHQVGVEFFGSASPAADAEVISLGLAYLEAAGLPSLSVSLNSIGCRNCRPAYVAKLKAHLMASAGTLCGDCQERAEKNPLRALDCKVQTCQPILDKAPSQAEHLCEDCRKHQSGLEGHLKSLNLPFKADSRLVRGFDYYTRTVFEVKSENLGAQNTVLGGGRYDHLVEDFGGPSVPAVGFGSGLERLLSLLDPASGDSKAQKRAALVTLGDKARALAPKLAADLRKEGKGKLAVVWDDLPGGPGAQIKKIAGWGFDYALILGDDEMAKGTAMVKNLSAQTQEEVPLSSLGARLLA